MRCGVLCDANGQVLRTWALVSDTAVVPVEHGDQITEWDVDHGEMLPHGADKFAKIADAVREQDRIAALTTQVAVANHGERYQRTMTSRVVVIDGVPDESIYYSPEHGIHHRQRIDGGAMVVTPISQSLRPNVGGDHA